MSFYDSVKKKQCSVSYDVTHLRIFRTIAMHCRSIDAESAAAPGCNLNLLRGTAMQDDAAQRAIAVAADGIGIVDLA